MKQKDCSDRRILGEDAYVLQHRLYRDPAGRVPRRHGGAGVMAEIAVRDDLGNVYTGEGQGGRGDASTGETTWRTTFGKLDENAKQLIITPSFRFFSSSGGGVAINEDGTETPVETYHVEREPRTVVLDEIVVDLQ